MFIEQLKDIVEKAEDILSEDAEGETGSGDLSQPHENLKGGSGFEVSFICSINAKAFLPLISNKLQGNYSSLLRLLILSFLKFSSKSTMSVWISWRTIRKHSQISFCILCADKYCPSA